jgi:hypothetical protein
MTKVLGDVTAQVITDQISVPASQAQHMLHLASGRSTKRPTDVP